MPSSTTTYASTQTAYTITQNTAEWGGTAPRWLDIPINNSFNPGNFWVALGYSTNTASTGAPTQASLISFDFRFPLMVQNAINPNFFGTAGANDFIRPFQGVIISTLLSVASIVSSDISTQNSRGIPPYQFINIP